MQYLITEDKPVGHPAVVLGITPGLAANCVLFLYTGYDPPTVAHPQRWQSGVRRDFDLTE